jgi:hypothetical protein
MAHFRIDLFDHRKRPWNHCHVDHLGKCGLHGRLARGGASSHRFRRPSFPDSGLAARVPWRFRRCTPNVVSQCTCPDNNAASALHAIFDSRSCMARFGFCTRSAGHGVVSILSESDASLHGKDRTRRLRVSVSERRRRGIERAIAALIVACFPRVVRSY